MTTRSLKEAWVPWSRPDAQPTGDAESRARLVCPHPGWVVSGFRLGGSSCHVPGSSGASSAMLSTGLDSLAPSGRRPGACTIRPEGPETGLSHAKIDPAQRHRTPARDTATARGFSAPGGRRSLFSTDRIAPAVFGGGPFSPPFPPTHFATRRIVSCFASRCETRDQRRPPAPRAAPLASDERQRADLRRLPHQRRRRLPAPR